MTELESLQQQVRRMATKLEAVRVEAHSFDGQSLDFNSQDTYSAKKAKLIVSAIQKILEGESK